jgi:Rrf2 family protein
MAGSTNTQFAVAVHVCTLLASMPDGPVSSELMAGSIGTNPVHVRRVLGHLRRAGLVSSRPGVQGGWRLERSPEQLTLGDVWRAVYGNSPVVGLHDDTNPECTVGRGIQATLGGVRERVDHAIEAELDTITVAAVLRDTVGESATVAALSASSARP